MATNNFSVRRTWERLRSVPGLGKDVLALTVAVAVGLTALVVILSNQRFVPPWADRFEFSADFVEAPAVNPSQHPKVRIAGVTVGQVDGSKVTKDGHARLHMSLERGHTIYDNARLVLRPINPVNEMYIEIDPGGPPGNPIPQNGVIPVSHTERPVQPDEVLQHLDARTRSALTNLLSVSDTALANAPERLPGGLNETRATVVEFKPVLEKLKKRRENIQRLVSALSQISAALGHNDKRVAQLVDSTQSTLAALSKNSGDLQAALSELPGTTDQLRNAMDSTKELTGQLNPTLDNLNVASDKLPGALRKTSEVAENLGKTVRAAKPVVDKAGPVVNDLKPMVDNVHGALGNLEPISGNLKEATSILVPYLNDLQAFIYNTSSVFSLSDVNGGYVRGHLAVPLPDGGVIPGSHGGNPYPNEKGDN